LFVTTPEENSDEELANLMADNENVDGAERDGKDGIGAVETGIPPQLDDSSPEVDSSEESFSINDFDEDFSHKVVKATRVMHQMKSVKKVNQK
jgi:hypothetical protein